MKRRDILKRGGIHAAGVQTDAGSVATRPGPEPRLSDGTMVAEGGALRFSAVTGRGTPRIDGDRAAEKTTRGTGGLEIAIPPGDQRREIALILEAVVVGERTGCRVSS